MADDKTATPGGGQSPAGDGDAAFPKPVAGEAAAPKPPQAAKVAPPVKAKPPPEAPKGPSEPPPPEDQAIPSFVTALQIGVPGAVVQVSYWVGDWTVVVPADRLIEVARFLRDQPSTAFDYCSDITAIDWPPREKRFDLVYCLYSIRLRHRLRLKVRIGETDPVPSVTQVWAMANWLEREVYDQFGVNIVNHPDRRRILMPDEWQGHPQRKDYPLEGPGEFLMENPQDWLNFRNLPDEAEIE